MSTARNRTERDEGATLCGDHAQDKPVSKTSVQHLQLNGACHSSDRDKQVSNSEETIEIRAQVVVILLVLVRTHDTAQDTWVKTNVFPQIIAALKSQKLATIDHPESPVA